MTNEEFDQTFFSAVVTCFKMVTANECRARMSYIPNDITDEDAIQHFKDAALANSMEEYWDKLGNWLPRKVGVNAKLKLWPAHSAAFRLAQGFKQFFKEVK